MPLRQMTFTNEAELDRWAAKNIHRFLPGAFHLPPFYIATDSGKNAKPDGFAFDFRTRRWFVIEAELLSHGVWQHIAEQIIRLIVALRSSESRWAVRDRLFDNLIQKKQAAAAAKQLSTSKDRLLQEIELFLEAIEPEVVVFIDETNSDLLVMAQALSAQIQIVTIQKFAINGKIEYHSPGYDEAFAPEKEPGQVGTMSDYDAVQLLGGGKVQISEGKVRLYELADGTRTVIKRSHFYPRENYYWYGITPATVDFCKRNAAGAIVFVMGSDGCARVPMKTVLKYLAATRATVNPDGTTRHYHCLISPPPDSELYISKGHKRYSLTKYYYEA